MVAHRPTPLVELPASIDASVRKRVCQACDRCRLKKSKCDGSSPCSRCKADNAICVFGQRKSSHDKVYPKGYVEMLENQQAQLVAGLQELYRRTLAGEGWTGASLKETSHGAPLTHDILDRLGALKQDFHITNDSFDEDTQALQQRLVDGGATFRQKDASSDTSSDIDHSPAFDNFPTRQSILTDSFVTSRFPPPPPNQSLFHSTSRTATSLKAQQFIQNLNPHIVNWIPTLNGSDDNMDFVNKFGPITMNDLPPQMLHTQISPSSLYPCLPMKDWVEEEDDYQVFNPTAV